MITGKSKTVLLPCYARSEFGSSQGGQAATGAYERWRQAARRAVANHLSAGFAVELVAIRHHEFNAWLSAHACQDGPQARLDYIRAARTEACQTLRPRAEGRLRTLAS